MRKTFGQGGNVPPGDEPQALDQVRSLLAAAMAAPGADALSRLAGVCSSCARAAEAEIDKRLGLRQLSLPLPGAEERWLTPREAAELLKTSERTLRRHWRTQHYCRPGASGHGFRVSLTGLREHMTGACGCDGGALGLPAKRPR